MSLNSRDPGSGSSANMRAHQYPIARALALTVLAALVLLFVLHHLVFNVSVTGGVK